MSAPDQFGAAWQEAYESAQLRDVPFSTMSGVPVEPVYGEGPYPGQFPYTRGIHASMYRSRLWTMRMFAGFGTAEDTTPGSRSCCATAAPACPPPSTYPR